MMKNTEELTKTDCFFIQSILQRIKYLKNNRSREGYARLDWENSLRNLGFDVKKQIKPARKIKAYY